MPKAARGRCGYFLMLWSGIAIMLLALVLSYTLNLPERVRYGVVGVVGLCGFGIASLAKRFAARS